MVQYQKNSKIPTFPSPQDIKTICGLRKPGPQTKEIKAFWHRPAAASWTIVATSWRLALLLSRQRQRAGDNLNSPICYSWRASFVLSGTGILVASTRGLHVCGSWLKISLTFTMQRQKEIWGIGPRIFLPSLRGVSGNNLCFPGEPPLELEDLHLHIQPGACRGWKFGKVPGLLGTCRRSLYKCGWLPYPR